MQRLLQEISRRPTSKKERQVKTASKNVVRDAIERDEKLQVHTC
jgi:hypothetical protein